MLPSQGDGATPAAPPSWADAGGPHAVEIERKYWFWGNVKALLILLGLIAGLAILALWLLEIPGMVSPEPDSILGAVVAFLLIFFLSMFLPEYVESFLDAALRLEGDLVTLSWRHARPKEVLLDGSAFIEVDVAMGHETGPVASGDIVGYMFWRPGIRRITAEEGTGFDVEDLVRIWPDVLAAACKGHTKVGPNLQHIVESVYGSTHELHIRAISDGDGGMTLTESREA
jgi:hypothetical protein